MLENFQRLAANGADLQHRISADGNPATLRQHIRDTLCRGLPAPAVTQEMMDGCFLAVRALPATDDPLHTGAIYEYAGQYLLAVHPADDPLLQKLHNSAKRLLSEDRATSRDDLRLVTLDALYYPHMLPSGIQNAYILHRLGLNGPRLSCEEIAHRTHKPLTFIHELEAALLRILSQHDSGGTHA